MNRSVDLVLSEIMKRLAAEFQPLKIILFGSRAKGTNQSDSDYDILVILNESTESWLDRCQRASRALRGCGGSVDVLVVTKNEFHEKSQELGTIYQIASSEGRELDLG